MRPTGELLRAALENIRALRRVLVVVELAAGGTGSEARTLAARAEEALRRLEDVEVMQGMVKLVFRASGAPPYPTVTLDGRPPRPHYDFHQAIVGPRGVKCTCEDAVYKDARLQEKPRYGLLCKHTLAGIAVALALGVMGDEAVTVAREAFKARLAAKGIEKRVRVGRSVEPEYA